MPSILKDRKVQLTMGPHQMVQHYLQPRRIWKTQLYLRVLNGSSWSDQGYREQSQEGGGPPNCEPVNLEGKPPATITQQGDVMNTFIYKYN